MDVIEKGIKGIIGDKYSFKGKGDKDYDGVKDKKDKHPRNPLQQ